MIQLFYLLFYYSITTTKIIHQMNKQIQCVVNRLKRHHRPCHRPHQQRQQ
jgi:hypothetical protein